LVGAALLSAAYWTEATLLRWRQGMPVAAVRATGSQPAPSAAAAPTAPPAETLAKLLGAPQVAPSPPPGPADRFKVLGVIASASGRGAALVAVDGRPARAYRVGAELAPGFVLRSVGQKELTLAASPDGEVLATLPLPEPGSASGAGLAATGSAAGAGVSAGTATGESAGPPSVAGSRGNPRALAPPASPATPASQP
jgi:general secretion pathway protein C